MTAPNLSTIHADIANSDPDTDAQAAAPGASSKCIACGLATWDLRAADAMAAAIESAVRRHDIDARSPMADALLDYRDPKPKSPALDVPSALRSTCVVCAASLEELIPVPHCLDTCIPTEEQEADYLDRLAEEQP